MTFGLRDLLTPEAHALPYYCVLLKQAGRAFASQFGEILLRRLPELATDYMIKSAGLHRGFIATMVPEALREQVGFGQSALASDLRRF